MGIRSNVLSAIFFYSLYSLSGSIPAMARATGSTVSGKVTFTVSSRNRNR